MNWDDEEYEAPEAATTNGAVVVTDKWEGEDEDDDDLKDNWDDEEEEKQDSDVPKTVPKKKKTLAEKIAEREEAKRQEAILKMQQAEAERELTPEEDLARKMREQKLAEEADFELSKEMFGTDDSVVVPGQKTIDNFVPKNKEEFTELANMIVEKLSTLEYKTDFNFFLETLVRDCCAGREPEDIKKISNTLTLLANEKQKLNKADKNKGKKKAAATTKKTLASGKGVSKADDDYYDDYYNEYDDFM